MIQTTPEEHQQEQNWKIIKKRLKDDLKVFDIHEVRVHTKETGLDWVQVDASFGGDRFDTGGFGTHLAVSLFDVVKSCMSHKYETVEGFSFSALDVDIDIGDESAFPRNRIRRSPSIAVEVRLCILNTRGEPLHFHAYAPSFNGAVMKSVFSAFEYLTNCEDAVKVIRKCIDDAEERNRQSLKGKYIRELAELVKTTDYPAPE